MKTLEVGCRRCEYQRSVVILRYKVTVCKTEIDSVALTSAPHPAGARDDEGG